MGLEKEIREMDRNEFRQQVTRRYVAGKAMDGSSFEEIAKGTVNPAEQMRYLSEQASTNAKPGALETPLVSILFFLVIFVCMVFCAVACRF